MKLVTWNCCAGPAARKLSALERLRADIAVVPECPRLTDLGPAALWYGENPRKGLAIVARPPFTLAFAQDAEELPKYVVPIRISGPVSFQLLAVWAKNTGPDKYVRGIIRAVEMCADRICAQPTVMLGDFNSNSIWDDEHPQEKNHSALVARLKDLGLLSAYHAFHLEDHGKETRHSYFQYRRPELAYHIDYCFVPRPWITQLKSVELGASYEWFHLSDHVPLVCDLTLPAETVTDTQAEGAN